MHKMQITVTDVRGVCPSVCYAAQLGFTVQKRLKRSRSSLGRAAEYSWGNKNIVLDGGLIPTACGGKNWKNC